MKKIFFTIIAIVIAAAGYLYFTGRIEAPVLQNNINADIEKALQSAPVDVSEFGGDGTVRLDGGTTQFGDGISHQKGNGIVTLITAGLDPAVVVKGDNADVYAIVEIGPGGSGTFAYLTHFAYIGATHSVTEVEKVMLGDRIGIDSINTEPISPAEYAVTVSIKERKLDEPMAAIPTQPRVLHFSLKGGKLHLDAVTYGTLEDHDLILISPIASTPIDSSIVVRGAAKGSWFFEASFPVELKDSKGKVVAISHAQAQGEWMTDKLVPFEATIKAPASLHGYAVLVLKKDNPSGLPENDKSIEVPIVLK